MATQRKVLVLRPGETGILKRSAKIVSVAIDGDLEVTTTCEEFEDDLENQEIFQCFMVGYNTGKNNNESEPFDGNSDTVVTSFGYLNRQFDLPNTFTGLDGKTGMDPELPQALSDKIVELADDGIFLYNAGVQVADPGNMETWQLSFKAPKSVADTFYLEFWVRDFGKVRVYARDCDECCPDNVGCDDDNT